MHPLTQSKNNVSAPELKRHLGVCYTSALLMKHKLLEVMRLREDGVSVAGIVGGDGGGHSARPQTSPLLFPS